MKQLIFFFIFSLGVFATMPILADSELPPVYQDLKMMLDKHQYTWGDTVNVTVIFPLGNIDPTIPDIIRTASSDVRGSANSKSAVLIDYPLTETGLDTGIFVGSFQIVKPGEQPQDGTSDGYLEVRPDVNHVFVMFDEFGEGASGLGVDFTNSSDPTLPENIYNQTKSAYPNAQFRWKESISSSEGIGIVRVEHPAQNLSDKTIDTLVARILSNYDDGPARVYVKLTETGINTGIFEQVIPITTQYSPTILTVKPHQSQHVSVRYFVDDTMTTDDDGFTLHNSLASPGLVQKGNQNPITLFTDKDWYLSDQQVLINGKAEPHEELDILIFGKKSALDKFRHATADSSGLFSTSMEWKEPEFHSGKYTVEIIGSKHDTITRNDITIVSLEQLRTHSIDVSPKQQLAMGISSNEIVCHQVWKLVLKPDGKTPVCLEPPTASKLEKRGWMMLHKTR